MVAFGGGDTMAVPNRMQKLDRGRGKYRCFSGIQWHLARPVPSSISLTRVWPGHC